MKCGEILNDSVHPMRCDRKPHDGGRHAVGDAAKWIDMEAENGRLREALRAALERWNPRTELSRSEYNKARAALEEG